MSNIPRRARRASLSLILGATLAVAAVALVAAACTAAEPTPVPTPVPTPTPLPIATPFPTPLPTPTLVPLPTRALSPPGTPTPTVEAETVETISLYIDANNMLNREEFREAERRFTTIVRIEPEFARAWDGRGRSKMFQGEYEDAMVDFDRAISLRPRVGSIYSNRAYTRYALGDRAGAERDARRAVELDDDLIDAHLVIALNLADRGEFEPALERFDRAIEIDPEQASSYWRRGRFYRDELRNGERALADFNQAIQLDPIRPGYFIDRGILLISFGMYAEAKWDMEEAISLAEDPELPNIIDAAQSWIDLIDDRWPGTEPMQFESLEPAG